MTVAVPTNVALLPLTDSDVTVPVTYMTLLLKAPQPTGPGRGAFSSNVRYVTGTVTSLSVSGISAMFVGTATVTGLGAGHDRPFTVRITAGGPGATVLLTVSGLTFHEILTDGHFDVS